MSINPRRRKRFKKRFAACVLLLVILGVVVFLLNIFFVSGKPLYISPLGKINTDKAQVEKLLKENKILFSQVTLSDYAYVVDIQDNGQVRLSQNKDIGKQITSLQKILRELTIEGKLFKSIDFRFSEPIVAF